MKTNCKQARWSVERKRTRQENKHVTITLFSLLRRPMAIHDCHIWKKKMSTWSYLNQVNRSISSRKSSLFRIIPLCSVICLSSSALQSIRYKSPATDTWSVRWKIVLYIRYGELDINKGHMMHTGSCRIKFTKPKQCYHVFLIRILWTRLQVSSDCINKLQ